MVTPVQLLSCICWYIYLYYLYYLFPQVPRITSQDFRTIFVDKTNFLTTKLILDLKMLLERSHQDLKFVSECPMGGSQDPRTDLLKFTTNFMTLLWNSVFVTYIIENHYFYLKRILRRTPGFKNQLYAIPKYIFNPRPICLLEQPSRGDF